MKHLDLALPTPAANLACDEALLDECENGGPEVLRFWEPRDYFVVVGYANHAGAEVNLEACRKKNVRIFRRCSGGGTVLQGPGCLNYALVLRMEGNDALQHINGTNRFIMERNRAALAQLLGRPVRVQGFTDLTVDDLKFSGNSQRRKRQALIFHGTFLRQFDLALVEELLRMPPRQPDYRQSRAHGKFLVNLNTPAAAIKAALRRAWSAESPLEQTPDFQTLAGQKYERDEWNLKY